MTPQRIPAMLVTMAMVAMATAQTTPYMPFQRPGEILPGLDIKFTIRHAGMMWNQPRALDTLSYTCENVIPVLSSAIPNNEFREEHWMPICTPIIAASKQTNPDTTALCSGVWSEIEAMIQDSMTGRRRRQINDGMGDEIFEMIILSLINASKLIYGVDPRNPDILTNSNIICGVADRFLLPSVPDQVVAFMMELLSGYHLDLAKTYACDNWNNIVATLGNQSDIFSDIADVGVRAMGFSDRMTLCVEIDSAITTGVTARKAFAATIVENTIKLFTEATPCKQYTNDAIAVVKRLFPAESGVDIDAYISGEGLNQYTGFSSIDEICDYIGNSFEYSEAIISTTTAGSNAASMSRLVAALMSLGVMVLSL